MRKAFWYGRGEMWRVESVNGGSDREDREEGRIS